MNEATPSSIRLHKKRLRKDLRQARLSLADAERLRMDTQICARIVQRVYERDLLRIAAYVAVGGEPDIAAALYEIDAEGGVICLPVLDPGQPGIMEFCTWQRGQPLRENRFGIPEPVDGKPLGIDELDLVILPVLGFSAAGNRLGMGGGYYDRMGAKRTQPGSPGLCGIAYSFQEAELGLPEPWDVPMDELITEQGWFTFPR